ncbi:DoxX protein [Comamonas thiooxydans]|nr:DoxX protein [Comamonas thiooxydans]
MALAGFTVLAALLTDRFRAAQQAGRQRAANAFFEHWGLVGGMLLVAWHDLGDSHAG